MKEWQKLKVQANTPIRDVMKTLDASLGAKIALVVGGEGSLIGTITDGDLRRFMLARQNLEGRADELMNANYVYCAPDDRQEDIQELMRANGVHQIPIVGQRGLLCGLHLDTDLAKPVCKTNLVVIMAGGEGRRLRPLTLDTPKPMLHVGGKPILETIIDNYILDGFSQFVLSVNYLSAQIEEYFGDGSSKGVHIKYLREDKPLGTAGALGLLESECFDDPVIVSNGDVLTRVSISKLIDFHTQSNAKLTLCLRDYKIEIPFGVVGVEKGAIISLTEKPVESFYVSAGIYVIEPSALALISGKTPLDMPELINKLIARDCGVSGFPLHEYWTDVGQHKDLLSADRDYFSIFDSA